jgi:hypothetical protein
MVRSQSLNFLENVSSHEIRIRTLLQVELGCESFTIRVQLRLFEKFSQQPYSQLSGDKTPNPNLISKYPRLNLTPSRIVKESKSKSNFDGTPRLCWSRKPNSSLTPPLNL